MRAVFGLVLLVGVGLAGFAIYMVNGFLEEQNVALQRERARAAAVVQTVEIYSPTRDITYGEEIKPEDIQLIQYAEDFLPEGVFRTSEEFFPQGENILRVATRPMSVNEPILESKVTAPGAPRGITALLEPGQRAFPLADATTRAFQGDLRIADRLDAYWTGRINNRQVTRLVMQNLEIIAMDDLDENGAGGRGVVLGVSAEQFADLQILRSSGSLSVSPVGSVEGIDFSANAADIERGLNDVLNIVEEVVEEPEVVVEERICTRRERRGVDTVVIEVPCPQGVD